MPNDSTKNIDSFEKLVENPAISLQDLLRLIHKTGLGVPHFQRGLVWDEDLKRKIFDSLFLSTPINSIIFWKPLKPKRQGRKFIGENSDPEYFIIDGQQRITSIYETLLQSSYNFEKGTFDSFNDEEAAAFLDKKQLCIAINNIGIGRIFGESVGNSDLFYIQKIRFISKTKSLRANDLLPVSWVYAPNPIPKDSPYLSYNLTNNRDELNKILREKVRNKITAMFSKKILVEVLIEDQLGKHNLSSVVDSYVRINSSGKKVIDAEMLYAVLNQIEEIDLKALFNKIHGETSNNAELQRSREGKFGLETFMRIFTLVFSYHANIPLNSSILEVTERLRSLLNSSSQEITTNVERVWGETKKIIELLADKDIGLLRRSDISGLYFDDLRYLPDTIITSLTPLIWIMTAYPEFRDSEENRSVHTYLALALILRNQNNKTSEESLFLKLSFSDYLNEIITICNKVIFSDDWEDSFNREISIQDYYLQLLYILLRKNKAADASLDNKFKNNKIIEEYKKEDYFVETVANNKILINSEIVPSKQHIVPRSKFSDKGDGRSFTNNIGNITYISSTLNSLRGLSDIPMNLQIEKDRENSNPHFFSNSFIEIYNTIIKNLSSDNILLDPNDEDYRRLLSTRIKDIVAGWREWLKTLQTAHKTLNDFPVSKIRRILVPSWKFAVDIVQKEDFRKRLKIRRFSKYRPRQNNFCRGAWFEYSGSQIQKKTLFKGAFITYGATFNNELVAFIENPPLAVEDSTHTIFRKSIIKNAKLYPNANFELIENPDSYQIIKRTEKIGEVDVEFIKNWYIESKHYFQELLR